MSSAHRQLKQLKQVVLKPHSLSMAQWSILGIIYDAEPDGLTLSDVAKQLRATQAFVSANVRSLEDKRFIKREIAEHDKRVSVVQLTRSTATTVEEIEATIRDQLRKKIYSEVSRDELAVFLHLMNVFADSSSDD